MAHNSVSHPVGVERTTRKDSLPTLLFRTYLLALVAILAIPLARLAAAPLALSWNRHR